METLVDKCAIKSNSRNYATLQIQQQQQQQQEEEKMKNQFNSKMIKEKRSEGIIMFCIFGGWGRGLVCK